METANVKVPDRINTTQKARKLISRIDDNKYFELQFPETTRSELYLYAMAEGADTIPTKLESIYPGGLVLDKSIDSRAKAIMYALYIYQLSPGRELDSITQKDAVYKMADEYANTGFEILESFFNEEKEEDLLWKMLSELDKQYDTIICTG